MSSEALEVALHEEAKTNKRLSELDVEWAAAVERLDEIMMEYRVQRNYLTITIERRMKLEAEQ